MGKARRLNLLLVLLLLLALPTVVLGITEKKTGTEYPDQISVMVGGQEVVMDATGVGLREKTFLKVDVYTIVSYVQGGADLGADDPGMALVLLQQPKRLQMDLRRSFSREKLINAFAEDIEKNFPDESPFADAMKIFEGYFTRDARDKDRIVFDYDPATGLTTTLNGKVRGVIHNQAFAEALWSVWLGKKPANDGLKRDLLSALGTD